MVKEREREWSRGVIEIANKLDREREIERKRESI
jgi:hypothetical protein